MKFKRLEIDLSPLYLKAKENFKKCIQDKDNEFLKNEVDIPLEDIEAIEKNIKIVFTQVDFEHYIFEVCLLLLEGSKEIGKYLYIANVEGEEIDDELFFY